MNPVIIMEDHRPWTEPPYGKDAVEASDIFFDPSIGDRGRFLYQNFGGTSADLEDAVTRWTEGRRSAFGPAPFSSREEYKPMIADVVPPKGTGSIAGELSYPSEGIPSLRVIARNLDTGHIYHVATKPTMGGKGSDSVYTISGLPAGRYTLSCYARAWHPNDDADTKPTDCGAWTEHVASKYKSPDHSLKVITVAEGQKVTGINPADWMGVTGDIPPYPF